MSFGLFDLAFISFVATAGVAAGWLLRSFDKGRAAVAPSSDSPPSFEQTPDDAEERARNALARVHDLAARMAADVGEHTSRVQEINDELAASDADSEIVVSAVARLIEANQKMETQLADAEKRLQEQARQIESVSAEARTDALTGLANRRAFDDEMTRRAAELYRQGRPVCVMMIDVDHFKKFNDTHGHQAGDEVLRGVARVLRQTMRQMDIAARYGGEEFAVIFTGTTIDEAKRGAERIRQAIETARYRFQGVELSVTVSEGVAQLQAGEETAALVKRADEALYESKKTGRNRASWHDGSHVLPIERESPAAEKPQASAKPAPPDSAPPAEARQPESAAAPAPAGGASPAEDDESIASILSGLASRTTYCEDVHRRVAEWKRGGAAISIVLLEIDAHQLIVRERGQKTAKRVLHSMVRLLQAEMRDMDQVALYDTHTFALLLPATSAVEAARVAERLRKTVSETPLAAPEGPLAFTVSLGVAAAASGDDAERLIRRAEAALDSAHGRGSNCCCVHEGRKVIEAESVLAAAS